MKRFLMGLVAGLALVASVAVADVYGPPPGAGSGFQDLTCAAHRWISSVTGGVGTCTQPAAADVSGLAAVATSGSATDLTTGTLPAARITALQAGTTETDVINQAFTVSTATLTKTSDTTPADIAGLSVTLTAGKTYHCKGHVSGTANASGGFKVVMTGTATATSDNFTAFIWNATTIVSNSTVTTGFPITVAATAVYTDMWIDGTVVVNAGGTLKLQGAQNASFGTATTFLVGSTWGCVRVN